jgi:uncharacterized Tic20 family protein
MQQNQSPPPHPAGPHRAVSQQPWPHPAAGQPWPHPAAGQPWSHPAAGQQAQLGSGPSEGDRSTAVLAHLAFFLVPVVGPGLVYLSAKVPFVRHAAAQAATLQAMSFGAAFVLPLLFAVVRIVWALSAQRRADSQWLMAVSIGLYVLVPLLFLLGAILAVVAASAVHKGKAWQLPLIGGLVARLTRSAL